MMATRITSLEAENTQLRDALIESNGIIAKLTARLDIIDQRATARARREFSTSSERSVPSVLSTESEGPIAEDTQFNEAEKTGSSGGPAAEGAQPDGDGKTEPDGGPEKQPRKRSVGRTEFSADLPREEIVVDPEDSPACRSRSAARCAASGRMWSRSSTTSPGS